MQHSEPNQNQKKCPPQNLHTAAVYVALRNFFIIYERYHLSEHDTQGEMFVFTRQARGARKTGKSLL